MTNLQAPQTPSEGPTHRMTDPLLIAERARDVQRYGDLRARQERERLAELLSEAATELRNNLGDDNVVLGRIQAFMREVRG